MRRARSLYISTPVVFRNERHDCGVRALRCAAGVSYEEAHAALERHGRRAKGLTYDSQMTHAAILFGFVPLDDGFPTLTRFLAAHSIGRFVIRTARHYFAIVDGVVHNWNSNNAGARCRVRMAWAHKPQEVS